MAILLIKRCSLIYQLFLKKGRLVDGRNCKGNLISEMWPLLIFSVSRQTKFGTVDDTGQK